MEKQSLGLIETVGYVPAIEAADIGSKAANVTVLGYGNVDAGLITVKFCGDVAAVKAAVSAAAAAAAKIGKVVSVHVIPRPDRQLNIGPPHAPPAPEGNPPASAMETKEAEQPVLELPPSPSEQEASPVSPEEGPAEDTAPGSSGFEIESTRPQPEDAGEERPKKLKKKKKGETGKG